MEQLWVTLLAVGTTLFSSSISGSVLHRAAGVPGYLEWIDHELVYTDIHLPFVFSQYDGPRIYEDLAVHPAPVDGQGQSSPDGSPNETLAVASNGDGEELSPAPVAETLAEKSRPNITQEQLYEQIFGGDSGSSEDNNAIEEGISSNGVETIEPIYPKMQASATVEESLVPQSRSEASPSQSSDSKTPIAPKQEGPLHPTPIPKDNVGEVYINSEEGKFQMQASLFPGEGHVLKVTVGDIPKLADSVPFIIPEPPVSGGDGLKITVGDIPKLTVDSVPVIIPEPPASGGDGLKVTVGDVHKLVVDSVPVIISELPASGSTKDNKPHITANVNVHLNVNGDGKGSVINSNSVGKLTAPIKADHKKCD